MATSHAAEDDDDETCRICRCPSEAGNELRHPCRCSGSIRLVHEGCLTQWLQHSHKSTCELCGYRYRFQPLMAPGTPDILPAVDLVPAVASAAHRWFAERRAHLAAVVVWGLLFPLAATVLYRCILHVPTLTDVSFITHRLTPRLLVIDWASGVVVILFLVCCLGA